MPPPPQIPVAGGSATSTSVALRLAATRRSLVPGESVYLAALFHVPSGSHIYWSNPGESGLPTTADFVAPGVFALHEVLYPGPERFVDGNGNESFGYRGEAALLTELDVPADLMASTYRFEVRATWLACSNVCVKESGAASLDLPVQRAGAPSVDEATERYVARVPTPLSDVPGWGHTWLASEAGTHDVSLFAPGLTLHEFFPEQQPRVDTPLPSSVPRDDGLIVSYTDASGVEVRGRLRGVVRATTPEGDRFFSVDVPTTHGATDTGVAANGP